MTKRLQSGLLILVLGILLTGCSLPATPTTVPVATAVVLSPATPVPDRLPFEGMWMTEGENPEIIVFTNDSMYRVISDQTSDSAAREQFAKIVSYDLAANYISLRTQMIRVNGKKYGYDSPNFNVTYLMEGDALQIGIGWDDQFAIETEPLMYYRK
ncbi:MAG: hypothetical protein QM730_20490 [Anaerolineales bacterium]